jgi:hypothetical protein
MKISRWCKPPDFSQKNASPERGDGKSRDTIPPPLPGLAVFFIRGRWFAPPANFPHASGVSGGSRRPAWDLALQSGCRI